MVAICSAPWFRKRSQDLIRALAVGLLLANAIGCGSTGRVQQQLAERMRANDYSGALQLVENQKNSVYRGKNRLLYYFERAMLLQIDGQYTESNVAFEAAKRVGDRFYTESLSRLGFSLVSNDYALDYAGENFERTLVHLFSALNYLMLREPDSALVEIRQVGDYLRKLQVDSKNENVYQEDAFARYLSALIYESGGEFDSAFVDYKKAAVAYDDYGVQYAVARPASLLPNAAHVASRLGAWAEEDLRLLGSGARPRRFPAGAGEIVVLHFNGLSPIKGQNKFTIPFSKAWPLAVALQAGVGHQGRADMNRAIAFSSQLSQVDFISVAFPIFVDRPYRIVRMQPRSDAALEILPAELVEDIGAIAEKDLADRIARIRAKTIARAAIKFAIQKGAETAARQASNETGALLGVATQIVGNIARFVSEQADQRVWSTLPDQIWMSSVILPEGVHDLALDFLDAGGNSVESRVISGIHITPGRRQFLIVRTVK